MQAIIVRTMRMVVGAAVVRRLCEHTQGSSARHAFGTYVQMLQRLSEAVSVWRSQLI